MCARKSRKSACRGARDVELHNSDSLPRDPENPYVIQGTLPGKPYSDLEKPWRGIRSRAGLDNVRIHDLRHSFATFGVSDGVSLQMVGGLLGQDSLTAKVVVVLRLLPVLGTALPARTSH